MCLDKTILIVVILYLINFRCLIILCMHAHSFITLDHELLIKFNLQFSSTVHYLYTQPIAYNNN